MCGGQIGDGGRGLARRGMHQCAPFDHQTVIGAVRDRLDVFQRIAVNDQQVRYGYNPDGDRTRVEGQGSAQAWEYDRLGRLVRAGDEQLRYDGAGRLVSKRRDGVELAAYAYDAFARRPKAS